MNQNPSISHTTLIRVAWLSIGAFLLLNFGLALLRLINKPFNPDELQHLHIAWLIAQGKIVYRDFWEHHGPLYSLFNGALIWISDPEPSVRILLWSRLLSLILSSIVGVLTWFIARNLGLSKTAAWLAVAAYSSLDMVQNKGVEMRPDVPQTLFWIGGILLLIRNQDAGSLKRAAYAGVLFALTILSNAKAGVGPFFAVTFYLVAHWLCNMKWTDIGRDLLGMLLGGLLTLAPILLYFFINDAALDFLYFNYVWNVLFNINWSADFQAAFTDSGTSLAEEYFWFYIREQLAFTVLAIAGAGFWIAKLWNEPDQGSKQRDWLFAIVTLGTTLGWLTNQHSQYFLVFLPLLSVLAGYALVRTANLFAPKHYVGGVALSTVLTIIAAVAMLTCSIANTPFRETALLMQQKAFTQRFVSMTSRDEPVAVLWGQCGGYMFNEITGFYWVAMPFHSEIIEIISGEHPFSESFIAEMERKKVRFVIGQQNWMTEGLSPEALDYLRNNFEYTNCLWSRK